MSRYKSVCMNIVLCTLFIILYFGGIYIGILIGGIL
jgi:hypothetical protein